MPRDERTPRNWGRMIVAAGIALAKSIVVGALVLVPGMLLIQEQRFLGWLWLLIGSFMMMAWSYRKEWRVTWIGMLCPPVLAIGTFIVQLAVFRHSPSLLWIVIAVAGGLAVGFARGETHQVFVKDNAVFAQRTVGFLAIWLLCYLITQYFSMMGQQKYLAIGHASGAFSAAMLTMVAVMLRAKFAERKQNLAKVRAPGKKRRPRKRRSTSAKTTGILAVLLTLGALSSNVPLAEAGAVGRITPDYSRLRPTPKLYFDHPVPVSRKVPGGPAVPVEFESRSGCDVRLRIYSPNPNYPTGRPNPGDRDAWIESLGKATPVSRVVSNSIRDYCTANPGTLICADCRPSVAGSGAAPAPAPDTGGSVAPVPPPGAGPVARSGAEPTIVGVPESGAEAAAEAAVITSIAVVIGASVVHITTAMAQAAVQQAGQATGTPVRGPPLPPGAQPDIINPWEQKPFDTDGKGKYLTPNDKGEWVWMNANDALESAAAMQKEVNRRKGEIAAHGRATQSMMEDWRRDWEAKQREAVIQLVNSGYVFDPATGTWRKAPSMPELGNVPDTEGIGYTTDFDPGLIFVDVNTKTLDGLLDDLDKIEREALDEYGDLDWLAGEAEADGNNWLADQLRKNKDRVRDHIGRIQASKNNITGAIRDENRRVADFDDKIHKVGARDVLGEMRDAAVSLVTHPVESLGDPLFVDDVKKGIAAAELVRKGEGIELRPGLVGYDTVKVGPSVTEKFDDALGKVRSLSDALEKARQRGDQEAVDRLTSELAAAGAEAQRASNDVQQHARNIRDWQVRSGVANISIARKGAEITAAASTPMQVGARSSVVGLVDDYQRGQGIFSRGVRSTGKLGAPVPKIKVRPGGSTVHYDSPAKPPTQTTFYPPERRPDFSQPPPTIIKPGKLRVPSQPKPPMQGIESGGIDLPRTDVGKGPRDPRWVGDLEPAPPQRPAGHADGAHLGSPTRPKSPPPTSPPASPKPATTPEPTVRSGARVKAIDEVHAHLRQNPAQKGDRYVNISSQRASQMDQAKALQPSTETGGRSDVIYSTQKGSGPAGYLSGDEATHVVRVPAKNTVDIRRIANGKFLDTAGKEIPLDKVKGKIIAMPAPEGTGDNLWYITPQGKLSPNIPRDLLQRWSTARKDWV